MSYKTFAIVIVCVTAFFVIEQTVVLLISKKRAKERGILRIKYPIVNGHTAVAAGIVFLFATLIILCVHSLKDDLSLLAEFQTHLAQASADAPEEAELLSKLVEYVSSNIERERYQIVFSVCLIIVELISIFTHGAYVTKEGVVHFGAFKPQKTAVRAECGAYSFFVGKKERYAFCLPLSEENEKLFSDFIVPEESGEILSEN